MASHHRASMQQPETYFLAQGSSTIPNSHLPVLVYRACISTPVSVSSISESFSVNHWLPGGVFKHYPTAHFHSVTHECYAVVKGSSRLLLGSTPSEHHAITGGLKGVEVILKERDAIVLPAGVAHCCLESFDEYEYVGLYPEGSPKYDNNFCKASEDETREKAIIASKVPLPDYDPVYGIEGPLLKIWNAADIQISHR